MTMRMNRFLAALTIALTAACGPAAPDARAAAGKAAISYRVIDGVALASADPIGDPEAWPGAIAAWRALVEGNGWTPAVIGCSELGATVYRITEAGRAFLRRVGR